jgi:hypothetical protein
MDPYDIDVFIDTTQISKSNETDRKKSKTKTSKQTKGPKKKSSLFKDIKKNKK